MGRRRLDDALQASREATCGSSWTWLFGEGSIVRGAYVMRGATTAAVGCSTPASRQRVHLAVQLLAIANHVKT